MTNKKWILIGIALVILISLNQNSQKQSVAAIQGQPCNTDNDCPCWGTYNLTPITNATAYGVGAASCTNVTHTCDMAYCVDIQPVGEWARDTPLQWVKQHVLATMLIIVGLIIGLSWPKI